MLPVIELKGPFMVSGRSIWIFLTTRPAISHPIKAEAKTAVIFVSKKLHAVPHCTAPVDRTRRPLITSSVLHLSTCIRNRKPQTRPKQSRVCPEEGRRIGPAAGRLPWPGRPRRSARETGEERRGQDGASHMCGESLRRAAEVHITSLPAGPRPPALPTAALHCTVRGRRNQCAPVHD